MSIRTMADAVAKLRKNGVEFKTACDEILQGEKVPIDEWSAYHAEIGSLLGVRSARARRSGNRPTRKRSKKSEKHSVFSEETIAFMIADAGILEAEEFIHHSEITLLPDLCPPYAY